MNISKIIKNNAIIAPVFAGVLVGICLLGITMPKTINADFASPTNAAYVVKNCNESVSYYITGKLNWVKTLKVVVTAYSSTIGQTDDTPFITASGKYVEDGIIANNMLPFGTKVKIPGLYGDKVFTVEDRMNRKKSNYHIDIWMPSYEQAKNFGVKTIDIQVLES